MVEPVLKFVVLLSGNGSNLQAVIDSCKFMPIRVTNVISNKADAYGLTRALGAGIKTTVLFSLKDEKRVDYDKRLWDVLEEMEYDYILLLGWMRLLSGWFISRVGSSRLINLHPALPGEFPGGNAISDAFNSGVKRTGVMVHNVVEEMDAGKVLGMVQVPIYPLDTLDSLTDRVQYFEKFVVMKVISELVESVYSFGLYKKASGKVRDIYNLDCNLLALVTTDRQSAFDHYICDIKGKGVILSNCSAWWFNQTRHIIPNHYVYHDGNVMIVHKCDPIKLEVVVRGYITGNTKTSLWTRYLLGERVYCGNNKSDNIILPDGLVKNQKLESVLVTPTTKGTVDVPISGAEVVERGILSCEEWEYVSKKALELFEYGSIVAESKGLILVDTKYEFGRTDKGEIILIDELHTCDSSRYWLLESYTSLFGSDGGIPESYDKDVLRNYLCENYDLYDLEKCSVPLEIKEKLSSVYHSFYRKLIGELEGDTYLKPDVVVSDYFRNHFSLGDSSRAFVVISDGMIDNTVEKLCDYLMSKGIYTIRETVCGDDESSIKKLDGVVERCKQKSVCTKTTTILVSDDRTLLSDWNWWLWRLVKNSQADATGDVVSMHLCGCDHDEYIYAKMQDLFKII